MFQRDPVSINTAIGQDIVLNCLPPIGIPIPDVTWEKDDQLLNVSENPRYIILDGGSLQITTVEADDAGGYMCVATNIAKRRNSERAVLTVVA